MYLIMKQLLHPGKWKVVMGQVMTTDSAESVGLQILRVHGFPQKKEFP